MSTVKIEVRSVGQNFGHEGRVIAGNNRAIHTTRVFPNGTETHAYHAAKTWAEENGHQIRDEDEDR